MKMHANAQTCTHCRALIVSRVLDDHTPPSRVSIDFRVSAATVHKWIRRFKRDGASGLVDRSSALSMCPGE